MPELAPERNAALTAGVHVGAISTTTHHDSPAPLLVIAVQLPRGLGFGGIPPIPAFLGILDQTADAVAAFATEAFGSTVFVTAASHLVDGVARSTNFAVFDRIAIPGEDRVGVTAAFDFFEGADQADEEWKLAFFIHEHTLDAQLNAALAKRMEEAVPSERPVLVGDVILDADDGTVVTQIIGRRRRSNGRLGVVAKAQWTERAFPANQPFVPCQPLSRVFVETTRDLTARRSGIDLGVLGELAFRRTFPARVPVEIPDISTGQPRPLALDLTYTAFEIRSEGTHAGFTSRMSGREVPRQPCARIDGPSSVVVREPTDRPVIGLSVETLDITAPMPVWTVSGKGGVAQLIAAERRTASVRFVPDDPVHQRNCAVDVSVSVAIADSNPVVAHRTVPVLVPVFATP